LLQTELLNDCYTELQASSASPKSSALAILYKN